jgi:hypothetical protein
LLEALVNDQTPVASEVTQSLTIATAYYIFEKTSAFEHERAAGADESQ